MLAQDRVKLEIGDRAIAGEVPRHHTVGSPARRGLRSLFSLERQSHSFSDNSNRYYNHRNIEQISYVPKLRRGRLRRSTMATRFVLSTLALRGAAMAGPPGAGFASAIAPPYYANKTPTPRLPCRYGGNAFADDSRQLQERSPIFACGLRCGGVGVRAGGRVRDTSLLMASNGGGIDSKNDAKYHLIWSRNFWKRLLVSVGVWLVVVRFVSSVDGNANLLDKILVPDVHSCHEPAAGAAFNGLQRIFPVVLPLLSSSCCAIQLVVNAVSGLGCAGFNTYLGRMTSCCSTALQIGCLSHLVMLLFLCFVRTAPPRVSSSAPFLDVEDDAASICWLDNLLIVGNLSS